MPRDGGGRMVKEKNLIVGLDIGTSKIAAIVAEIANDGALNVIGMGTQPSRGLKKGVVVNIEATMASIQRVLEEAELMADCAITEVYTAIGGGHIRSYGGGSVHVRGYYRSNGTYVHSHWRSAPGSRDSRRSLTSCEAAAPT